MITELLIDINDWEITITKNNNLTALLTDNHYLVKLITVLIIIAIIEMPKGVIMTKS